MPDRGTKRGRRDDSPSDTKRGRFGRKKKAAAAESQASDPRASFRSDSGMSDDAASKMAERKAQRENLKALRERTISAVSEESPAKRGKSPRKSPAKAKAAAKPATKRTKAAAAAAAPQPGAPPLVVILRGPAAAGKSTIAASVVAMLRCAGRSVCFLEQDFFRGDACLGHGPQSAAVSAKMLKGCADAALEGGYDLVLEGILNSDPEQGGEYRPLLAGLVARGEEENAGSGFAANVGLFYLDVPLKTTKLRHSERAKAADFGTEKLDEWWSSSQKSGLQGEVNVAAARSGGEAGVLGATAAVLAHLGLGPGGQVL